MVALVTPGAPRPNNSHSAPPPPTYTPNMNTASDSSLLQNFQNFHINQDQNSRPVRPPPFAQAPNFPPFAAGQPSSFPGPSPVPRPGPPPSGVAPIATSVSSGLMAPPNMVPGRAFGGPSLGAQPQHPTSRPPSQGPFAVAGLAPPSLVPGRPFGGSPPGAQHQPFASRPPSQLNALPSASTCGPPISQLEAPPMAHLSAFGSPPSATGQVAPPTAIPGLVNNGPPMISTGTVLSGSQFPAPGGLQQPPVGPHLSPFRGASPPLGSPFGVQPLPFHQVTPSMPGSVQPPRMYGMPPPGTTQTMAAMSAISQTGPSKIDPNQIPRPLPNSSVVVHETRVGNQAAFPPPATTEYVAKDTGNCSPRYMRCTINQIPCTSDLLGTSGMQLALLVQPLALPHPSEEAIQVVDFGEGGPVRCSRCKAYINPFVKFIDQGRKFICNLCGFTDETPRDYQCNLGPDGRRRDADERPELCRGTVEFIASKDYMVRSPMRAVFFFLIDVSMNALQTGATAAACSAINQVIADLPDGSRTMVGIATFNSTIHFYNLKRASQQPLMLIVPDVQDVYTPLETDVIVPLSECRQHVELLLESIPTMFETNKTADSALGAAMKAAFLAMKSTGGKLLVFQSVLPSVGIGALSARVAEGVSNTSVEKVVSCNSGRSTRFGSHWRYGSLGLMI